MIVRWLQILSHTIPDWDPDPFARYAPKASLFAAERDADRLEPVEPASSFGSVPTFSLAAEFARFASDRLHLPGSTLPRHPTGELGA